MCIYLVLIHSLGVCCCVILNNENEDTIVFLDRVTLTLQQSLYYVCNEPVGVTHRTLFKGCLSLIFGKCYQPGT